MQLPSSLNEHSEGINFSVSCVVQSDFFDRMEFGEMDREQ
jgi:hypothetical protein